MKKQLVNEFAKIYRSEKYSNANKLPLSEFPFMVDVEPTNHCNLMCKMCSRNVMKRECGNMSLEVYKNVVDECAKYGSAIRLIRWGEHFLHPQIFDFISYTKEKGVLLHMTTNGLLLNSERAEKLVNLGIDSLIISMQGADKEGYEDMRNNNKYDLLVNNIKNLMEIRRLHGKEIPFVHISSTVTDEPDEKVNEFVEFWEAIVDSVGVGKTYFAMVDKDDYHDKIAQYLPRETVKKIYSPCTEVYQKISVNWNGDITACCADHDNYMILGNVKSMSLREAWHCDKMNNYRKMLDEMGMEKLPLCRDCYHTYDGI
ncbi:radical SAM protein [Acetivibrio cellulolyticus]|uniref:radical SAM protein n=1 Tax=Acetivibrio cellulolyticus TaxID=35830 RepID=UPI0001E2FB4C|nr:radical SAM protein [Acetivibrio cellulolyticus]